MKKFQVPIANIESVSQGKDPIEFIRAKITELNLPDEVGIESDGGDVLIDYVSKSTFLRVFGALTAAHLKFQFIEEEENSVFGALSAEAQRDMMIFFHSAIQHNDTVRVGYVRKEMKLALQKWGVNDDGNLLDDFVAAATLLKVVKQEELFNDINEEHGELFVSIAVDKVIRDLLISGEMQDVMVEDFVSKVAEAV